MPQVSYSDTNSNQSQLLIGDINGTNAGRYRSLKFTNGTTTNNNDGSVSVSISGGSGGGSATPGGSQGSVQFLDVQGTVTAFGGNNGFFYSGTGSTAGNVGIGTITPQGSLVVTNGNVGIGTWSPVHPFQVGTENSTTNRRFSVNQDGNVGIGPYTTGLQTAYYLDIADLYLFSPTQFAYFGTINQQVTGATSNTFRAEINELITDIRLSADVGANKLYFGTDNNTYINSTSSTNADLQFNTNNLERMRVNFSGNVGIGTQTPGVNLDVQGTVRMNNFVLTTNPTSGYVLTTNSVGVGTWAPSSGGGSGANPGGSATQLQYQVNGTTFGGISGSSVVSGNIGLGSSSPGQILDVQGTVRALAFNGTGTSFNTFTGNVGIGSTNPGQILDVTGKGRFSQDVYLAIASGSVGIGVTTPQAKLDIHGSSVYVNPTSGSASVQFQNNDSIKGIVGYNTSSGDMNYSQDPGFVAGLNVDPNNNIGIGSTKPGLTLDINGVVRVTSTNTLSLGNDGNLTMSASAATNADEIFKTNANERMRITNSGNVGIGSASPGQILDVQGTVRITSPGNGNSYFGSGNVGIGSINPGQALDVQGTVRASGFSGQASGTLLCVKTGGGIGYCSGTVTLVACTCN